MVYPTEEAPWQEEGQENIGVWVSLGDRDTMPIGKSLYIKFIRSTTIPEDSINVSFNCVLGIRASLTLVFPVVLVPEIKLLPTLIGRMP